MWLLIPDGFYSIVRRDGEADLCVRARQASDLDLLRKIHVPELSETVETRGTDYRYRAWASPEAIADGLAVIARGVDYPNFKAELERRDPERAAAYAAVWGILADLQPGGPFS